MEIIRMISQYANPEGIKYIKQRVIISHNNESLQFDLQRDKYTNIITEVKPLFNKQKLKTQNQLIIAQAFDNEIDADLDINLFMSEVGQPQKFQKIVYIKDQNEYGTLWNKEPKWLTYEIIINTVEPNIS